MLGSAICSSQYVMYADTVKVVVATGMPRRCWSRNLLSSLRASRSVSPSCATPMTPKRSSLRRTRCRSARRIWTVCVRSMISSAIESTTAAR